MIGIDVAMVSYTKLVIVQDRFSWTTLMKDLAL